MASEGVVWVSMAAGKRSRRYHDCDRPRCHNKETTLPKLPTLRSYAVAAGFKRCDACRRVNG